MAKTLKTYDPERIVIIIGGHKVEGFAPDKRVKITHPQRYNMVEGTDGEVARGKTNMSSITVTIELLQTSLSNDVLSGFYGADDAAPGGAPLPLFIKDLDGTALWAAAGCWVEQLPEVEYGAAVGTNVWVYKTGPAQMFIGGKVSAT